MNSPLPPLTPEEADREAEQFATLDPIEPRDRVFVYTKPACVQCTMTVKQLARLNVPFETRDATELGNFEFLQENGIRSAPGVQFRDEVFGGFQPDRLQQIADTLHGATDTDPSGPAAQQEAA